MRIAINTRFLLSTKMEGFGWYTLEVVKRIVKQHPEHEFFFFFDRPYDKKFVFAKNVTPIVLKPPARHPILFYIWFEWSVKKALKEHRIDVFFSPDGFLSLGSKVPQTAVIHDLNFEYYPQDIPWQPRLYLRYFFPKFAKKAARIVTVSHYSKQDICRTYGIPEERVTVGWNGASDLFRPLESETVASVRNQRSGGKPYFIFVGALHPRKNVGRLLEAFREFATGNNEIDLLIVGEALWKNTQIALPEMPEEVKARIHFTGHVSQIELTQLMASAYALVFVPYFEGFGIPLVEAMKSGIPIISGDKTSLPEVAGDAALYCDPFDAGEITERMRELANDPSLRETLKQKGLERGKLFSWNRTAEVCWEAIVAARK